MLQLNITLLVNKANEPLLPSKVFNDADVGQNFVGSMNASIGSRKDEFLDLGKLACNIHIDREKDDHHADTSDTTIAEDPVKQYNCDHNLDGSVGPEEVQVSTNFADFESINGHEVDDRSSGHL